MIGVEVCEEDRGDPARIDIGLNEAASGANSAVDQIFAAVDDQQGGGLGPVEPQGRPAGRTEKQDLRAGRGGGRCARSRERGQSECATADKTPHEDVA